MKDCAVIVGMGNIKCKLCAHSFGGVGICVCVHRINRLTSVRRLAGMSVAFSSELPKPTMCSVLLDVGHLIEADVF